MVIKQSKATPWANGTKQPNANPVPYRGKAQQKNGMNEQMESDRVFFRTTI
jgi:hypothetical protein